MSVVVVVVVVFAPHKDARKQVLVHRAGRDRSERKKTNAQQAEINFKVLCWCTYWKQYMLKAKPCRFICLYTPKKIRPKNNTFQPHEEHDS